MEEKMKNQNPVVWFEIYVNDMARARKFYEQMLAIELSELPMPDGGDLQMMAFPGDMESKNRAAGSLVKMDGFEAGHNSTIVYFYSEDCSIEEKRIERAGGSVFRPKTSIGQYGFITLGKDTEGNLFGIHSMN
jgi:predicted enzyme related to lactoylglutathione lyase